MTDSNINNEYNKKEFPPMYTIIDFNTNYEYEKKKIASSKNNSEFYEPHYVPAHSESDKLFGADAELMEGCAQCLSCGLSSKPMKDYNKASNMQLRIIENGFDSLKILTDNVKLIGNKLTVGDLGCSHGRNSMAVINKLLGLIENNASISNKLIDLLVYHEDLESNDFSQVQECLDDKSISYLNNSYIKNNNISTEVQLLPKSFYESLFEPKTIDIIMCYTAIHWLPKYKSLTQGLWFQDQLEPSENIEWFRKLSKDCLINWLNLRYDELATGGLLTLNIMESSEFFESFNLIWDEYLIMKGFTHDDLKKVNVAGIYRSTEEVNECLDKFNEKYKILRNYLSKDVHAFCRSHLNSVISEQVIQGLENYPEHFPTTESRIEFYEEFLDYLYNAKEMSTEVEIGYIYLILQKI
ncbi:S-adenosyl-L-methionine-dependent methyltransferase [Conidiobolus coronatus NRRL 28638]|uniref:S-adenosyl-L-methionine-dependent methyltransferase n=1 Tax=Conidiobolus coronatus (strain ATCC 28846 / CBS 209.66 / NRRL 28638) TaxID=796925 RepID=A0A137NZ74_CONC2|nr:S-adenosyl-L-methionine-dependent methyltransferase [Conidiobolus coronatus NRRL 28638]|eukprot:KXN67934.1 S-adenosyl-L-methionine-dependent methyltransferase [Conidiobolus coronatus NRRL 28638]